MRKTDAATLPSPDASVETERTIGDFLSEKFGGVSDLTALVHEGTRWTYRDLDAYSATIAREIVHLAEGKSAPVALLVGKSPLFVGAWLGILRSGMILVPMDPTDPEARIRQILEDSGAAIVVTESAGEKHQDWLRALEVALILADTITPDAAPPARTLPHTPDDPALLVYTSGSTGTPKGVVQLHRNLVMTAIRLTEAFDYSASDRIAHTANTGFVLSTMLLVAALANGATVHLFDLKSRTAASVAEAIVREGITCMHLTPTVMRQLVECLGGSTIGTLRQLRLAGEPLFRRDVEFIRRSLPPDCAIYCGYGATEMNFSRLYHVPPNEELDTEIIPVGHAVDGVVTLLLDEDGNEVPPGAEGVIHLQSPYLAQGYWRRPAETAAAFLPAPNPSPEQGERMYRTGDVGRFREDGCLEVLGRDDQQVKIRGVRIETAEVERVIMDHPAVKAAVVIKCEPSPGDERLAAFWVPEGSATATGAELRRFAATRLPGAMVPAHFFEKTAFPATPSGKIHRAALREEALALSHATQEDAGEPPDSPIETILSEIWRDILKVASVGVTDHFFELGGHSLLVLKMIETVETRLGIRLSPETLLRAPTIRLLAAEVACSRAESADERLVEIHDQGLAVPLWVIGSHRNTFFEYASLLELLPRDRPIRMAGPNHECDGEMALGGVADVAAELAEIIRARQPKGGLILLGHCMGGMIAMEVARRIEAEGGRVDRVILIEPPAIRAWLRPLRALVARWGKLRGLTLERQVALFLAWRAWAVRWEARLRNWKSWLSPAAIKNRLAQAHGAPPSGASPDSESELLPPSPAKSHVARAVGGATLDRLGGSTLREYHPVIRIHFPRPCLAPLTVIRAGSSEISQQPYAKWRAEWIRFGGDRIEIQVIPGGHHSILRHPQVRELARVVRERLKPEPGSPV